MSLQLYVEDLVGGGNHAVIYATTFTQGKNWTTLWPLGWHGRSLVLAVVKACTFEQIPYPLAWHVVDAASAVRLVSVGSSTCLPGWWPSRAGLTCVDYTRSQIKVYDWSGRVTATLKANLAIQPALSPSGTSVSLANGGPGDPSPVTTVWPTTGGTPVTIPGAMACLWVDDTAMLAPGAVIRYPSGTIVSEPGGYCAGRFPGGL